MFTRLANQKLTKGHNSDTSDLISLVLELVQDIININRLCTLRENVSYHGHIISQSGIKERAITLTRVI